MILKDESVEINEALNIKDLIKKAKKTKAGKALKNFFGAIKNPGKFKDDNGTPISQKAKRIQIGGLYTYAYLAKGWVEKTLPFFDATPLVLVVGLYPDGFLGLNFHYLPIPVRMKLMEQIIKAAKLDKKINNKKAQIRKRKKLTYQYVNSLQNVPAFKNMIKRYLVKQIKSPPVSFTIENWFSIMQLPGARFVGKSAKDVQSGK